MIGHKEITCVSSRNKGCQGHSQPNVRHNHTFDFLETKATKNIRVYTNIFHQVFTLFLFSVVLFMVASSNGNIFRVTGHCYGEFIGHRWIPRTKVSDAWINGWVNNREAGDLRRHRTHYDVIVMCGQIDPLSEIFMWSVSSRIISSPLAQCNRPGEYEVTLNGMVNREHNRITNTMHDSCDVLQT